MNHQHKNRITHENSCYWQHSFQPLSFSSLQSNADTDVVISGGGIAGVTIAYNLLCSGKKVILVENGLIGNSDPGRSNSHLVTAVDHRYYNLERLLGQKQTKILANAYKDAIDFIEKTILECSIDCEFERVDGLVFLNASGKRALIHKELKAARKADVAVTDLPFVLGMNQHIPCLKFYNQAQFHPLKYLKGLCDSVVKMGGQIYTNTAIDSIDDKGITTKTGYRINAANIVLTTGSEEPDQRKKYRNYSIAARIKKDSIRKFLWWEIGDNQERSKKPGNHYVRIQKYNNEYDLLICGGENHSIGIINNNSVSEEHYSNLESWMRSRFSALDIIYRWYNDEYEVLNHIGYIGKKAGTSNAYIVSSDSGNGMMNGIIAGTIIPDLINGKQNKYAAVFDPSYIPSSKTKILLNEIMKYAGDYLKLKLQNLRYYKRKYENDYSKLENLTEQEHTNIINAAGTDGLHLNGNIYWNNDEESWDRIHQKQ